MPLPLHAPSSQAASKLIAAVLESHSSLLHRAPSECLSLTEANGSQLLALHLIESSSWKSATSGGGSPGSLKQVQ